jgi:rhamnulokinase
VTAVVGAVDLGASSGRVMFGRVGDGVLDLTQAHRFANGPVLVGGTLHWDILGIYREILHGLAAVGRVANRLDAIGIDSWAVDYGLLDRSGALLGNPVNYRDSRTQGVMERVLSIVPAADIYASTGLQFLPINTLYQLVAAVDAPQTALADRLLLIPDLLTYWLTGTEGAEVTNASTTQLLNVSTRSWDVELMRRVGINPGLFPAVHEAGTRRGDATPEVLESTGLTGPVPVIAVGTHDTASAVVGVPAQRERFAYISCGTWSLVGVELATPVLTDDSREANFTNELGVDGTVRYLRNVMGLWLLQESLRIWNATGQAVQLEMLLADAARVAPFSAVVDVDDPVFLPPGDMPARIAELCRHTDQDPPREHAGYVRCILDSLAIAYRKAVRAAQELSGREIEVVHLVGGGARNTLLCQLTADACGRPVVAGPFEATALGNVLVQARALGALDGDLSSLRALVRETQRLQRFDPAGDTGAWDAAEARIAVT